MTKSDQTGNVGEWSELYALCSVLANKGVFAADRNEKKIDDLFYEVVSARRSNLVYVIQGPNVDISKDGLLLKSVQLDEIGSLKDQLFNRLLERPQGRAFPLDIGTNILEVLGGAGIKANSSTKSDIELVTLNPITRGKLPERGFSVKSQLGAPATLLNASTSTTFVYKVVGQGCPQGLEPKELKKNTQKIYEQGFSLEFLRVNSVKYFENMRMIDSNLPQYIAELLVGFYRYKGGSLSEVVKKTFPSDTDQKSFKIKQFLIASALGMMPNTKWDGIVEGMGGMLIVKRDGDVLCFYLYNLADFGDFLISHTKFDTGSTTRYKTGQVELDEESGELHYKLNLQIRFIK